MFRLLMPAMFASAILVGTASAQRDADGPLGLGLDDPPYSQELARAMFEATRADPKQIIQQKLETTTREYRSFMAGSAGCGLIPDGMFDGPGWSQRLLAVELTTCESLADQAAAYKRHWWVMWEVNQFAQSKYDAGRETIHGVMAARCQQLTAEIDWIRARTKAGNEKPHTSIGKLHDYWAPTWYDGDKQWAAAQFAAARADIGDLARQRIAAARVAYRGWLKDYDIGKSVLDFLIESAESVTQAERAVAVGKEEEAAVRERAWEMAWMTHKVALYKEKRIAPTDLAVTRYALLQAEIALVRAGQFKRPNRIDSLLYEPELAERFDANVFARARAEVGRTDIKGLLQHQLETARTGYRIRLAEFDAGKTVFDSLLECTKQLFESELAVADGPAAREAAHVRYWKRQWRTEAITRSKYDAGRGTRSEMLIARYARLDAELLWAQARQARK